MLCHDLLSFSYGQCEFSGWRTLYVRYFMHHSQLFDRQTHTQTCASDVCVCALMSIIHINIAILFLVKQLNAANWFSCQFLMTFSVFFFFFFNWYRFSLITIHQHSLMPTILQFFTQVCQFIYLMCLHFFRFCFLLFLFLSFVNPVDLLLFIVYIFTQQR